MGCPDENVLAGYVDGALKRDRRGEVERHISRCASCRALVSGLAQMQHATGEITEQDVHGTAQTMIDRGTRGGRGRDAFVSGRPSVETIDLPASRYVHLVPGTLVGEYEVTGRIGAGGMGAVYSAVQPRIGKRVAIKVLQRELAGDATAIVRFENEAKAVNEIGHPNIVDIFGFGELPDGNPYFVMEHVEGTSLHAYLEKRGRLSLDQAMSILRQIFDALAAAHARGIIHRDLKPGNIMVSGPDHAPRVKVLDFGLAKITSTTEYNDELTLPGVAMGTPHFMSPEQYLGEGVDHRTDIYALGIVVYQMLCGRIPFEGNTPTAVRVQHLAIEPPAPSSVVPTLPRTVDNVMHKALAKDANERYSSVDELKGALEHCLTTQGAVDTVPPIRDAHAPVAVAVASPSSPVSRSRVAIAAALGGAIAVAVITFVLVRDTKRSAAPTPPESPPVASPTPTPAVQSTPSPPVTTTPPAAPPVVPETPPVVTEAPPIATEPKSPARSRPPRTKTPPKTTTPPKTGTGSAAKPCDPYRSIDGC